MQRVLDSSKKSSYHPGKGANRPERQDLVAIGRYMFTLEIGNASARTLHGRYTRPGLGRPPFPVRSTSWKRKIEIAKLFFRLENHKIALFADTQNIPKVR